MMQHIRVSEILAQFRNLSMINPTVLREKGLIGTEVHKNIHEYKTGGLEIFDIYPMRDRNGDIKQKDNVPLWEERGKTYFDSYVMWDKENKPKFGIMEERYYDDNLMITGQIDALMTTSSLPVLVDFKCAYNADLEMWSMQAHYYKHLLQHNGIEIADHFLFLKLDSKGRIPAVHEIKFDEKMRARCIFEAISLKKKKKDAENVATNDADIV